MYRENLGSKAFVPLNTRGWVVQERYLTRQLNFAKDAVY